MPDQEIRSNIDNGIVDEKSIAAIEKSLKQKESKSAPSTQEQLGNFVNWRQVRDELGQPFDVEQLSVKKLRQIRRDPMLAFGLHYRKTPLVRAKWHMEARDKNGPNAQVAGFMDAAWRKIHARYVFQHTQDFDFGFAAIVKRFQEANPGGHYYDPSEENLDNALKPVWDEGSILPITWKTFIGLPPERVQPKFTDDGDFDGILYEKNPNNTGGQTAGRKTSSSGKNDNEQDIDVYHALWTTNDRDSVFGSIFGYPLIQHSFRYWWSYWFLWANLDRAFERMAIPPMLAYHPEGTYVDPEDDTLEIPYSEIALEVAESLRSNAVAAVPSTLATAGMEEKGTQEREWAFEFLETPEANFDMINKHLSYLDVMKLRSVWVPEQAFIEGDGGSSSRNVAQQMGEIFIESQANKWSEIEDHINRYVLPQILAVNFPEFVANGGTCNIVGHGFAKEDMELLKQLIQLVGQDNTKLLDVDMRTALDRANIPLLSPADAAKKRTEAAAEAQQVPEVTGGGGVQTVDVTQIPGAGAPNTGFTNGGSQPEPNSSVTGFSDDQRFVYWNGIESIQFSDHQDFLTELPDSGHYTDKTMRALTVQMRALWIGALRELYGDFASYMHNQKTEVNLADITLDDIEKELYFADVSRTKAEKAAKKLFKGWKESSKKIQEYARRSRALAKKMAERAAKLGSKKQKTETTFENDDFQDFLDEQIGRLITSVVDTTKEQLRVRLVNGIVEGKTADQIALDITQHFTDFPIWRADSIARSETRDAYNFGTLLAVEKAGLKYVRAKDAQKGPTDAECEERNGKLYTVKEARVEMSPKKTHTRCTLEFEPIIRAEFSVQNVRLLPDAAPEDAAAWYDKDTSTAYVPVDLSDEESDMFLSAVLDHDEVLMA